MKKKLLSLAWLLAVMVSVYAGNGTLSIANVTNVVAGQTGSLDIVITGSDNLYRDFMFDITLPDGLTYVDKTKGALINGTSDEEFYTVTRSDQGGNKNRFTGYTSATNTMKAANGVLLTITFTVGSSVTSVGNISLSGVNFSDASSTSYIIADIPSVPFGMSVSLSEDAAPTTQNSVFVTMNRTFTAGKWSTICLPFAMTASQVTNAFGGGVQIGDFNGYTFDGHTINVAFTSVSAIAANHPYIIKVPTTITSFSISDAPVDISPAATPQNDKSDGKIKKMVGVYAETTLSADLLYIKDNKFWYSQGSSKLKPYHAYFEFGDFSSTSSARSMTLSFGGDATGIIPVVGPTGHADAIYDLRGHRVETPDDGVYIQNGRKSVIRREKK